MSENGNGQFNIIHEQIQIEVDAARRYMSNQLFHPALRRYDAALKFYEHLSEHDKDAIKGLFKEITYQRAIIFLQLGNPQKVIEICQYMLNTRNDSIEETFEINRLLGKAYFNIGKYEETIIKLAPVEQYFSEKLIEQEDEETLHQTGQIVTTIAFAHLYRNSFDIGSDKLYLARELFVDSKNLLSLSQCDIVLGELALFCNEPRTAMFHIHTAFNVIKSLGGGARQGQTAHLYGRLERQCGNFPAAISYYKQAIQLFNAHNMPSQAFIVLIDLAHFYSALHDDDKMEDTFLEAEDLCNYMTLSYSEQVYLKLNRFENAVTNQNHLALTDLRLTGRELIRILRDQNSTYKLHHTILQLLLLELRVGDSSLAKELCLELESYWRSFHVDPYPLKAIFSATIALNNEKFREAERILIESLKNFETGGWEQFECLTYTTLAKIEYQELNSPTLAHEYFQQALSVYEQSRSFYKLPFLRPVFRYFLSDPYQLFIEFLLEQHATKMILPVIERKLLFDQKVGFGTDIGHRLVPKGLTIVQQAKWDEYVTLSKRLLYQEASFEVSSPYDFKFERIFHENETQMVLDTLEQVNYLQTAQKIRQHREKKYQQLKKLEKEIIAEDPRWSNILNIDTQFLEQLKANFPKRSVFLLYFTGENRSHGFLVENGLDFNSFNIPFSRSKLLEMIQNFVTAIRDGNNEERQASLLWDHILGPVFEKIPEKTERIIIIPHDIFWLLPFHVMKNQRKYLWDHYDIEYSPSLTHFFQVNNPEKTEFRKRFLTKAFQIPGCAEYASDLTPLEKVSNQKKSIDAIRLYKKAFTKQEFWGALKEANILIFGSRFYLQEGWPASSYFEVGKKDSRDSDTRVRFDEIIENTFKNVDIVIFPEVSYVTNDPETFTAKALFYRTWLHAGVPTLLHTLWPSDPVALSLALQRFLINKSTMSLSQALRKSSLQLRDSHSFTLIRDWAPLCLIGYGGWLVKEPRGKLFFNR